MVTPRTPSGARRASVPIALPAATRVRPGEVSDVQNVTEREQRLLLRPELATPAVPPPTTEPPPSPNGLPGGEPAPLPSDPVPLLQLILQELQRQGALLGTFQEDMRALRQVLAGPFRFLTFAPLSVGLTVPLNILAGQVLSLVPVQSFPGSLVSLVVGLSAPSARIIPTLDGTNNVLDVTDLVTEEVAAALAPSAVVLQADAANNLFTIALNPGAPEGLTFFRSFALTVQNIGTATIQLTNFSVVLRRYIPLTLFPELTEL